MKGSSNNSDTIPMVIAIGILVVVVIGALFAYPPTREGIFNIFRGGNERIVSVDNSRIISVDLDNFDPGIEISSVVENSLQYVVTYRVHTIEVIDGVWQDVVVEKTIVIPRNELAEGIDVGEYLTAVVKQDVETIKLKLKLAQEEQREIGLTVKVVETIPGGLGSIIFVPETVTNPPAYVPPSEEGGTPQTPGDSMPPIVIVVGDNPTIIEQGAAYVDLGVVVYDNTDPDPELSVQNSVDTSVIGTYAVIYTAIDATGNSGSAGRDVRVVAVGTAPEPDEDEPTDEDEDDGGQPYTPPDDDDDEETPETPTGTTYDTTPPVLSYIGASAVLVLEGGTYTDLGAIAEDDYDGFISDRVHTINNVNTAFAGTYSVTYTVSDNAGNQAAPLVRTVTVLPNESGGGDGYVVPETGGPYQGGKEFIFP